MDLRFAFRSLRKNPGFAVLAVAVMGLGIGANTAMFSVVNSVLLKPLHYTDPDRIVRLSALSKKGGGHGMVSAPDFQDWHDQSSAFSAMASFDAGQDVVMAGPVAEYGYIAQVTPEFFKAFAVEPMVGRVFNQEEARAGGAGAVLISHSFWQSHYGGSTGVLSQSMRVGGKSYPIVGVLPPRFHFPDETDIWTPSDMSPERESRSAHNYLVVGRLKPGVSLEEARAQMNAIGERLEQQYPRSNRNQGVLVTLLRDELVGTDVRTTLYVLLGAVGLVLLIACANMANLLLAKATVRTREMAIRAAMGASRGRIVKQLIIESLVLAMASGVAGLLFAIWGSNALVSLAPKDVPRLAETGIDGWVLAFTFAVSVAASLVFGLAPAIHASKVDLNHALKQGSGRAMSGTGASRMRGALVVAEVALSVILLAGAGLLLKSFVALNQVALGFRPDNVLVMGTSVPSSGPEGSQRAGRFYRDLLAAASAMPGVSAAGATRVPPGQVMSWGGYWVDHLPDRSAMTVSAPQAVFSIMAPGTLAALGIPLKSGRDFSWDDTADAPFAALINESLARKSFPGEDPIGRSIFCGFDSQKPMKIVGIVADIHQFGPARAPWAEIYMPSPQHRGTSAMSVVVRTTSEPTALFETMRRKARDLAPDVPVKFTTMEARMAENVAAPRFRTLLFGIFAGLAVCLAMAGVYGVMAYAVGQRANEIGLRMALGASASDVLGLVLRQGMLLVAIGLAIGVAGASATTRLLSNMLFRVKPGDPLTYAGVVAVLAAVAMAASYIPARRATKVDPLVALRQE